MDVTSVRVERLRTVDASRAGGVNRGMNAVKNTVAGHPVGCAPPPPSPDRESRKVSRSSPRDRAPVAIEDDGELKDRALSRRNVTECADLLDSSQ
jgi:hypothetical protein